MNALFARLDLNEIISGNWIPDDFAAVGRLIVFASVWFVTDLLPVIGISWLIYYGLTLPLRRRERPRLFLHLLEMEIRAGRSPELAILELAKCHDRVLGIRFRILAAHLE